MNNSRRSFLKSLFGVAAAAALSIRMTPFEEESHKSLPQFKDWIQQFMKQGNEEKLAIIGPKSYRAIMRYVGTQVKPEAGITYSIS